MFKNICIYRENYKVTTHAQGMVQKKSWEDLKFIPQADPWHREPKTMKSTLIKTENNNKNQQTLGNGRI